MSVHRVSLGIPALCVAALLSGAARPQRSFTFTRSVGNVEFSAGSLSRVPPAPATRVPASGSEIWFGGIPRRLPGDVVSLSTDHFVVFAVAYDGGVASRVWCDADLDGDLTDDPPPQLAGYPARDAARSFLVTLQWTAQLAGRRFPIERLVRVVLDRFPDAPSPPGPAPGYRLQMVHAMLGSVELESRIHRAFLLDGNGDGLYTRDLFDGLFVDLDDDGHFLVDQMSPEFGSFSVPFTMGRRAYEVVSLDPEGRELSLRELGPAPELPPPPAAGRPAPDFSYRDAEGRVVRLSDYRGRNVLVWFWASRCPACADQAPRLRQLYDRLHPAGLEILGVSYDTDRSAMEAFREEHHQVWPTSFSGRQAWEDPVGRLYREHRTGALYLVDPAGILEGDYATVEEVESALAARPACDGGDQRQSPAATKPPQ